MNVFYLHDLRALLFLFVVAYSMKKPLYRQESYAVGEAPDLEPEDDGFWPFFEDVVDVQTIRQNSGNFLLRSDVLSDFLPYSCIPDLFKEKNMNIFQAFLAGHAGHPIFRRNMEMMVECERFGIFSLFHFVDFVGDEACHSRSKICLKIEIQIQVFF